MTNFWVSWGQVEQLHKIFKLCGSPADEYWRKYRLPNATIFKPQQPYKRCISETFKDFPPSSLPLIETLLSIDPDGRGTALAALNSEVSDPCGLTLYLRIEIKHISHLFGICSFLPLSPMLVNRRVCQSILLAKNWM